RNHYRCARCGREWTDKWSAACDDDCPHCGARHMSPLTSEPATTLRGLVSHIVRQIADARDRGEDNPAWLDQLEDDAIEALGAESSHVQLAAANGWTFEAYGEPVVPPGFWWRYCRHGEESNDPEELRFGAAVITADTARGACERDGLEIMPQD